MWASMPVVPAVVARLEERDEWDRVEAGAVAFALHHHVVGVMRFLLKLQ